MGDAPVAASVGPVSSWVQCCTWVRAASARASTPWRPCARTDDRRHPHAVERGAADLEPVDACHRRADPLHPSHVPRGVLRDRVIPAGHQVVHRGAADPYRLAQFGVHIRHQARVVATQRRVIPPAVPPTPG